MDAEILLRIVVAVVAMILSCTVHEWAHAWAANRLGDTSAKADGRLTLNPSVHIDPLGTILLPAISAALGGGLIGWGKTAEVRPHYFRRDVPMRKGIVLWALAGPVANVGLACLATIAFGLSAYVAAVAPATLDTVKAFRLFAEMMLTTNAVLAIFNLLPVPPLDGYRILGGTLGGDHPLVRFLEEQRFILFIALLLLANWVVMKPASLLIAVIATVFGG